MVGMWLDFGWKSVKTNQNEWKRMTKQSILKPPKTLINQQQCRFDATNVKENKIRSIFGAGRIPDT